MPPPLINSLLMLRCNCKGEVTDQPESPNKEDIKRVHLLKKRSITTPIKRLEREVLLSDDSENVEAEGSDVTPRSNTPHKRRRRVLSDDESDNTDSEMGKPTPQKDDVAAHHKSVSSPSYSCSSSPTTPSTLTSSTKKSKRPVKPVNTLAPRFKCRIVSEVWKLYISYI